MLMIYWLIRGIRYLFLPKEKKEKIKVEKEARKRRIEAEIAAENQRREKLQKEEANQREENLLAAKAAQRQRRQNNYYGILKKMISLDLINPNKKVNWSDNLIKRVGLDWEMTNFKELKPEDLNESLAFRIEYAYNKNGTISKTHAPTAIYPEDVDCYEWQIYNNSIYYRFSEKRRKEILSNPITYAALIKFYPELSEQTKTDAKKEFAKAERAKITPALRLKIIQRDGYRCRICGASADEGARLEVDHRIPIAKGGLSTEDNLWTLCFDCNRGKGDKLLNEAPSI